MSAFENSAVMTVQLTGIFRISTCKINK